MLIRLSNEDYVSVMARGNANVVGVPYKVFHWTPGFNEDEDSHYLTMGQATRNGNYII